MSPTASGSPIQSSGACSPRDWPATRWATGCYLVIDGVDGRTHYVETADADQAGRDQARPYRLARSRCRPRPSRGRPTSTSHAMAEANGGIYRPSEHLEATRDIIERRHGDPDAFIRSHVRRLEALRRAGHVERIDADHWKIPADIAERGVAYDAPGRPKDFAVRTLSTLDLERQIGSDGATWLDRELVADARTRWPSGLRPGGEGCAPAPRRAAGGDGPRHGLGDGRHHPAQGPIAALERQEVDRVGTADGGRARAALCAERAGGICDRRGWRASPISPAGASP